MANENSGSAGDYMGNRATPHNSDSMPCRATWHYVEYQGRSYSTYVIDVETIAAPQSLLVVVEADASGKPALIHGADLDDAVRALSDDELALAAVRLIAARAAA
jgi:hypothetical protein